MSEHQILSVEPWESGGAVEPSISSEFVFVCAYEILVEMIADLTELAFIRRTADRDELWVAVDPPPEILAALAELPKPAGVDPSRPIKAGRAVVARRASNVLSAATALLGALFEARKGYGSPQQLLLGGLVDRQAYEAVRAELRREHDENTEAALLEELNEIVIAAEELNLRPRPTGTGPHHWAANCPGTNHTLMIESETNQFGCGYCRRNGGRDELRAFVEERANR